MHSLSMSVPGGPSAVVNDFTSNAGGIANPSLRGSQHIGAAKVGVFSSFQIRQPITLVTRGELAVIWPPIFRDASRELANGFDATSVEIFDG